MRRTAAVNPLESVGRSFIAYMAGFGGVALADTLVESFRVADLAMWGRRKKLSDPQYRRLILLSSVLIGAALPTAITILLLPWQTGYDSNFAGHSVTLASLYQS